MMFLEKYQTLIHHNKSGIYKFVCMPIISTNEKEIKKNEFKKDFKEYKPFCEEDLKHFDKEVDKIQKTKENLQLLNEANKNLEKIVIKNNIKFQ